VKAIPGLRSASLSTLSPLDGRDRGVIIEVPGFVPQGDRDMNVSVNQITSDFFGTLGISVLQGRTFSQTDVKSGQRVALLNETAARFYFGDRNAVNAKIRFSRPPVDQPYEIVGVVRDSRQSNLREDPPRLVYMPVQQSLGKLSRLTLSAHTSGDPTSLVNPIREQIRALGADLLVTDVVTLDQQVNQTLSIERLVSALSAVFGLLASLLACIGLYGVMSYDVARRTREIGIRVALGAQGSDVMRMVMGDTLLMILIGLAIGLGVSIMASRLIASLLFGLSPNDPLTIGLVAPALAAVALLAGYLPAARAARVEPMVALRHE
jgi:predicted permease